MRFLSKRAQSTAEYAIVIALVIGAAVAMQIYVKRGLQGGMRFATDKLKNRTGQYEPYYYQSEAETARERVYNTEETKDGGGVTRTVGTGAGGAELTTRGFRQEMKNTTVAD
jgi:hypothetical protein